MPSPFRWERVSSRRWRKRWPAPVLNRSYISKAFRFGFTKFEVHDPSSPITFIAPGKKMMAMPMRVDDTTEPATGNAEGANQNHSQAPNKEQAPLRLETP
jgi:hypothetical protein